ncbi:hypothetical protein ABIA39_006769 [Nocardia sp. GAS34]
METGQVGENASVRRVHSGPAAAAGGSTYSMVGDVPIRMGRAGCTDVRVVDVALGPRVNGAVTTEAERLRWRSRGLAFAPVWADAARADSSVWEEYDVRMRLWSGVDGCCR